MGDDPGEEAKIERGWFRALVFVFEALPQTVKLAELQGVPLIQLWSMAYLGAFLTVELLRVVAKAEGYELNILSTVPRHDYSDDIATVLRRTNGIFQTLTWAWVATAAFLCYIPFHNAMHSTQFVMLVAFTLLPWGIIFRIAV